MKILHMCLACFYIDNYSYQENLLPKYHKKMGYDVKILASLMSFDSNGNRCYLPEASEYINQEGIPVKRLSYKKPEKIGKLLRTYVETFAAIDEYKPDIIFIHGVQFADISQVVKYVKMNPNTKIFVDNHSDFFNSASSWISRNVQHKILWKYFAQKINPYVKKFYGVLPARVNFLVHMYDLPKEKVELLVMGADDEFVESAADPINRDRIRSKYNIRNDDFLIMSGGKIDLHKQQILLLMDAVNEINNPKVKLIIFGSVVDELKEAVDKRCSDKVQYIGWVKSEESYGYFAASDLVVFPCKHSVFWEQVAGQGIPMICKYWEGVTDVDCGGNVYFLYQDSVDEICRGIKRVMDEYDSFQIAAQNAKQVFSYKAIAARSIDLV